MRPVRHGSALLTPALPLVWQLNALRVEDLEAAPADLAEEADRVLAAYGHRKLVVHDAELGERLARPLAASGWNVLRLLVMVHERRPKREQPAGAGAELDRKTGAAGLAAFRREQPFGWQEQAVDQLAGMDERYDRAASGRNFGSPRRQPRLRLPPLHVGRDRSGGRGRHGRDAPRARSRKRRRARGRRLGRRRGL